MKTVQVFRYVEELDAFLVTDEFGRLADTLGLTEWTPVVWVGRLFTLDNDYGEHWFDNWDERDALQEKAAVLGIDAFDLMIVAPDRMKDGSDGPCHTSETRKQFWTDVLRSLQLSHALIFAEARAFNQRNQTLLPAYYLPDLEERIADLTNEA